MKIVSIDSVDKQKLKSIICVANVEIFIKMCKGYILFIKYLKNNILKSLEAFLWLEYQSEYLCCESSTMC